MSDLSITEAQKLIQEYKSIIRLLQDKTAEFKEILNKENLNAKDFNNLLNKLQQIKEEFENSSFSVLQKENELFNNLNSIVTKINELSKFLNTLTDKKSNLEKEIKKEYEATLMHIGEVLNVELGKIKKKTEKNVFDLKTVYTTLNAEIKDLHEETKEISSKYRKLLKSSLNAFKKQIEEDYEELRGKTFFQRWGAVIIALGIGFLIGSGTVLVKFRKGISFDFKYADTCRINNRTYKCYIIPNKNFLYIGDKYSALKR